MLPVALIFIGHSATDGVTVVTVRAGLAAGTLVWELLGLLSSALVILIRHQTVPDRNTIAAKTLNIFARFNLFIVNQS
jgi:hypothetical protein